MKLTFIDHFHTLLQVVGLLVFSHDVVRVSYDCYNEVHENHEQVENTYYKNEPCENN